MPLTVLSLGYPFAAVGPDAVGGAEQILAALDAALVRAGHRSIVIAQEGSRVCGELMPIPRYDGVVNDAAYADIHKHVRSAIAHALDRWAVDVMHFHGVDYDAYIPLGGPPAIATLHLPIAWYRPMAVFPRRPATSVVCVSESQRRSLPEDAPHVTVITNGIPIAPPPAVARERFALTLGRICPEKGYEHALDAARLARIPLRMAGRVFAYPEHQRYFREQIVPRLDTDRCFVGIASREMKQHLLARAHCVLVPSVVAETSSLIVMEALAAGTPVIAFPCGALAELVDDGVTGFLVGSVAEMARAIDRVDAIDRSACMAAAHARFADARMVAAYFELYAARGAQASAISA